MVQLEDTTGKHVQLEDAHYLEVRMPPSGMGNGANGIVLEQNCYLAMR